MRTIDSTGRVPRFLLAHLGWILLVTVVVTAAAAGFSWSRTAMYKAEADVLVAPRLLSTSITPQSPDMGTEKAIVSSGVVISAASSALLVGPKELSGGLSVDVPVDTHVLKIQYTHVDPREARRRAQGLAEAYVALHAQERPPAPAAAAAHDPKDASPASPLAGTVEGFIITPAGVPAEPATPNHLVDLAVALVVGLALGLGTAVVRDRMDDRLRGPEDLETQAGEPVLAAIPAFRVLRRGPAGRLVTVGHPQSRVAAIYRDLRTRVFQSAIQQGARTLLVINAVGREKTAVAANLAVALAQSGLHVVLVDADLRRPRAHQLFGLDNEVGLTEVIGAGHELSLPLPLVPTGVGRLTLLRAGRPVTDPGAVLQSPALPRVLDELTRTADFVVVDAPPMLTGADATVLMGLVDMMLFVADLRRVTRAQVRAAMRQAEPVRRKLIGCVLDNVGPRTYLWRHPEPPPAPADGDAGRGSSPHGNGRYVGRVSSSVTNEHAVLSTNQPEPN
jgi:succinoglycan biosynthesis transport protein ExoP